MKKLYSLVSVMVFFFMFSAGIYAADQPMSSKEFMSKCEAVNNKIPAVVKGYITGFRECNGSFLALRVEVGSSYSIYYWPSLGKYRLNIEATKEPVYFDDLESLIDAIVPASRPVVDLYNQNSAKEAMRSIENRIPRFYKGHIVKPGFVTEVGNGVIMIGSEQLYFELGRTQKEDLFKVNVNDKPFETHELAKALQKIRPRTPDDLKFGKWK